MLLANKERHLLPKKKKNLIRIEKMIPTRNRWPTLLIISKANSLERVKRFFSWAPSPLIFIHKVVTWPESLQILALAFYSTVFLFQRIFNKGKNQIFMEKSQLQYGHKNLSFSWLSEKRVTKMKRDRVSINGKVTTIWRRK